MTACTVAAVLRVPIGAPAIIRPPMTMVIGVMLGTGFTSQTIGNIATWGPTVIGLAGFVIVSGAVCVTYFRRVAGFDVPTAFFAGMPGGLVEMVILGETKGGDAGKIALVHSARVLLVVLTLPFLMQLISGVALGARPQLGLSVLDAPWTSHAWLASSVVAGAIIGKILRLPARLLLGPMLVSAAVHMLGWTHFVPSYEIVNVAQVVLGTTIGCRFAGTSPREIIRILVISIGSTFILLTITFLFASGISYVSTYDFVPLTLAYSPGGLAEMSLVALSLGIDVAFVATHHIIRVVLVMVGAGPAFTILKHS
ncbi:AbrB family transcriptional regulator [Microvirga makkahensis]|uniref:AbrB family transcriptional regulator n=2 Tax=Microvirga makkahensis TaxID=1128670 RepID=A0A7X3SN14_9HYPH|nr:AbrB family transcriptional regulator [Microvirga makkahensis]